MTLIMHINLVIYSLFVSGKVLPTAWVSTPVHPPLAPGGGGEPKAKI